MSIFMALPGLQHPYILQISHVVKFRFTLEKHMELVIFEKNPDPWF